MNLEDWNLCQTAVRDRRGGYYFISTAHRLSSTSPPHGYFETLVWHYPKCHEEEGKIISMRDSGSYVATALKRHERIARVLTTRMAHRHKKLAKLEKQDD